MKTCSVAYQTFLRGNGTSRANCFRLQLRDGTVMGFTDHDQDLQINDNVFPNLALPSNLVTYAAATGFTRAAMSKNASLDVPNVEIDGPVLVSGGILASDLRAGRYDFAQVVWFECNHRDLTMGVLVISRGYIGEIAPADNAFKGTLLGLTQALSRYFIREITPQCDATFCDANTDNRCKLDPTLFTETGTVTGVTDPSGLFAATITGSRPAGNFADGELTWTSGLNDGIVCEVKSQSGSTLTLFLPTSEPIQVGDTFSILTGCDHSLTGTFGCQFYNNVVNFRGFPAVPGYDAIVAGAAGIVGEP